MSTNTSEAADISVARRMPTRMLPIALTWRQAAKELLLLWAATLAGLVAFVDLSNLRTPFGYGGDSLLYLRIAKTLVATGSFQTSPRLGAPFGQDLHDYPLGGDNGQFLILRFMASVVHDPALLLNLYFLLTFFLISSTAWLAARLLGAGGPLAIAVGLIYSFAPYHFDRIAHLMLANYWALPIGVLLAVRAAHSMSFESPRTSRGLLVSGMTLVGCVVVGSFGAYYAVFVTMTVAVLCLVLALTYRTVRPLMHGIAVGAVITAALVANLWSSIAYGRANGSNPIATARAATELDIYGLRLIDLLRPVSNSYLGGPSALADRLPSNPWAVPNQTLSAWWDLSRQ